VIVEDLAPPELDRCLRQGGLRLRTGPVVTNIRSPLSAVRRGIALHYSQHAVEPDSGFVDFHISVKRPRSVRRWVGKQVVFDFDGSQPFAPLPGGQGFALLEWGLNWCVSSQCHQYLIVHAAVLERGGRALILPAASGSGKSTLCAGLVFGGGWRLLSDELALIDPANGHVVPLPRPLSLKNESIDVLHGFAPAALFGDVVHETSKGRVAHVQPPADGVLRASQIALPAWVVLPRFVAGAPAQLRPLSRARGFMALVDNAFNYNVHGRAGFAAFGDVIDRSACHEFSYSSLAEAVAVFDELARAGR
jgi:HprK-related kinase A